MARYSRHSWRKRAIIEETPEYIVYRYPDGSEVRETNMKIFFSDPDKPKQPTDKSSELSRSITL